MVFAEDHSLLKVSPLLRGDLHEVLQVDHSAPRANFNRYSLAAHKTLCDDIAMQKRKRACIQMEKETSALSAYKVYVPSFSRDNA